MSVLHVYRTPQSPYGSLEIHLYITRQPSLRAPMRNNPLFKDICVKTYFYGEMFQILLGEAEGAHLLMFSFPIKWFRGHTPGRDMWVSSRRSWREKSARIHSGRPRCDLYWEWTGDVYLTQAASLASGLLSSCSSGKYWKTVSSPRLTPAFLIHPSLSVSLSLCFHLSLSLCLYSSLFLSLFVTLSLSLCHSVSLSLCLPICLPAYLSV